MWCIHCFQLVQSTFPTSRNVGDIFPSLMTESMQQETPLPAARFLSKHPRTRTAYLLHAARRQHADAECGSSLSIFKPRSKASHSNTNKKALRRSRSSLRATLTVVLLGHHGKARHLAVDRIARSNRCMEGGTGEDAAFRSPRKNMEIISNSALVVNAIFKQDSLFVTRLVNPMVHLKK